MSTSKLKQIKLNKKCPDCDIQISDTSKRCRVCANLGKRNPGWGKYGKLNGMYGIKRYGHENPRWLGDKLKKYTTIHHRIWALYGKANKCENINCDEKNSIYEWSNKNHKYDLNKEDWQMLCHKCHAKYDKDNNLRYKK